MELIYSTDNYWPRISGMPVSIDSFKHELEKIGHSVSVMAPKYSNDPDLQDEGDALRFNGHRLFFSKEDRLVKLRERKNVHEQLQRISPDIVHVQTELNMGRLTRDWAIMNRVPIVMTCHTNWEQYINHYLPWLPQKASRAGVKSFMRNFYSKCDSLITPTDLMRDTLVDYGVEKEIYVIPTGINKEQFIGIDKDHEKTESKLYKEFPQLLNRKVLLYAGRIGHEKNIMFLLEVLKRVTLEFPDVILLMAGEGPQKQEMISKARALNLEKNILFAGYVPYGSMKYYYSLADIFVFPSKTETQGLVTAEAMLCRTPVVAIGEMGTKNVMRGDNGGFMVEDDLISFSDKVLLLLKDEGLHRSKSQEAYRYSQGFTSEESCKKLLNVYEQLLLTKKK